jgi:hypothetical protein
MATTSPAAKELYPLSTQDGYAIPLDVIYPQGLIKKSIPSSGLASFAVPTTFKIASFYSLEGCIVQFGNGTLVNPMADGAEYLDSLLIPPGFMLVAAVTTGAGNWTVESLTGIVGTLWIQEVRKWADMALARQVTGRNK